MRIKNVALTDLKKDPNNARKHNKRNIDLIGQSLREVGAARSGVVDENGVILAGNGTFDALKAGGIKTITVVETAGDEWVVVQRKGLTEKQKRLLALADNRAAEFAEWDAEKLSVQGIDLVPWFGDDKPNSVVDFGEPPEDVKETIHELEEIHKARRKANEETAEKRDTEKYICVVFSSRDEKEALLKRLGLPADERYLLASAVMILPCKKIMPIVSERPAKSASRKKSGANG